MRRPAFLAILVLISATGCKESRPIHTPEEVAAFTRTVERARTMVKKKTAEWHKAMSEAIELMPVLGEKCPHYDIYPVEYFDIDGWMGVHQRKWDKDSKPNLALKASEIVKRQEESLANKQLGSLRYQAERLDPIATDAYWDYDLALMDLMVDIPDQQGHTGKFTGGALLVRAFLYSHKEKKVICEGIYQVGTGKTVTISYTSIGTEKEIADERAAMDVKNLGARGMSMAVQLDLRRKAYFSAFSHLQRVTERSDKPFPVGGAGAKESAAGTEAAPPN